MKKYALIVFIVFIIATGFFAYKKIFTGDPVASAATEKTYYQNNLPTARDTTDGYNNLTEDGVQLETLMLYPKDNRWNVINNGTSGEFKYNNEIFIFKSIGLKPKTNYTLLRFDDTFPGISNCLISGVSDDGGNLELEGKLKDGGPKIWLILSEDIDCEKGINMCSNNVSNYLFENNLIKVE